VLAGRLVNAEQFLDAAKIVEVMADEDDLLDAQITLCVHAGIAAADVICCSRLGHHSSSQDHRKAVTLLAKAAQEVSADFGRLLQMKTRSGYGPLRSSATTAKSAMRIADRLVEAARRL